MRRFRAALALAMLVSALGISPGTAQPPPPPVKRSNPGQINVVTVNARQNHILGLKRFEDLLALSVALRRRPAAFDGGARGAAAAPDVIVAQEIRFSNLEILTLLLRQRYDLDYQIVGAPEATRAQVIANTSTVDTVGDPVVWEDVCYRSADPAIRRPRRYQFLRFTEKATGLPFTVANIHFHKNYSESSQTECFMANLREMRAQLAGEQGPVIIGGDFNRRPVAEFPQCDPFERSQASAWWRLMTTGSDGGRAYVDAVRRHHRRAGASLGDEWTHEQRTPQPVCDGLAPGLRRSRIDFLFAAGAEIGDAHADHPGWSGGPPGTNHLSNHKYSDHRFVAGRFLIGDAPRPDRPIAAPISRGRIDLTWGPVEGAARLVVYRAVGRKPFGRLARLDGEETTYRDAATEHGRRYRYAIAAIGARGAQGLESGPARAEADARGPRVTRTSPAPGSVRAGRRPTLAVRFDERVDETSVGDRTIRLFRGRREIRGRVTQVDRRTVTFRPARRLARRTTYRAVVVPVRDMLGNTGPRFTWRFTT